ncbi:hypothetical protein QJS10_CPA03g00474 [Acorus calamus]|uniref:Uncharacterized protein n=1 Tax=Acorus calamus TaxID=4465 RepID=A0AAV9F6J4_ACOCL|nr:hypothetical protein QJS10_CPA03g00474 [Acorus calamus]
MGNYVSCASLTSNATHSKMETKVVLPSGEVRRLDNIQSNAAELMLDSPGHFAAAARSLVEGRRFSPLAADEELELGEVYVMFPMRRVDSFVTRADVGRVVLAAAAAAAAAEAARRAQKGARVGPEAAAAEGVVVEEARRVVLEGAEFRQRLSVCRSRKPLLETIVEEGVCSR